MNASANANANANANADADAYAYAYAYAYADADTYVLYGYVMLLTGSNSTLELVGQSDTIRSLNAAVNRPYLAVVQYMRSSHSLSPPLV